LDIPHVETDDILQPSSHSSVSSASHPLPSSHKPKAIGFAPDAPDSSLSSLRKRHLSVNAASSYTTALAPLPSAPIDSPSSQLQIVSLTGKPPTDLPSASSEIERASMQPLLTSLPCLIPQLIPPPLLIDDLPPSPDSSHSSSPTPADESHLLISPCPKRHASFTDYVDYLRDTDNPLSLNSVLLHCDPLKLPTFSSRDKYKYYCITKPPLSFTSDMVTLSSQVCTHSTPLSVKLADMDLHYLHTLLSGTLYPNQHTFPLLTHPYWTLTSQDRHGFESTDYFHDKSWGNIDPNDHVSFFPLPKFTPYYPLS
jgi:hypothetical protein